MLRIYTYKACSTCRNAIKWLNSHGIPFEEIPIRVTPPSATELSSALKAHGGKLGTLFNTSGSDYRAMEIKDKLPTLTEAQAFDLLARNGNLVKRPVAIQSEKSIALVGFKPEAWQQAFGV